MYLIDKVDVVGIRDTKLLVLDILDIRKIFIVWQFSPRQACHFIYKIKLPSNFYSSFNSVDWNTPFYYIKLFCECSKWVSCHYNFYNNYNYSPVSDKDYEKGEDPTFFLFDTFLAYI